MVGWSARQGADLDQVVGEDAVPGPCPGDVDAVEVAAVPSVVAFQVADAAFAAGSPFHGAPKCRSMFGGLAGLAGSALAGDHDGAHAYLVQVVVDLLLAVAAVGGDGAGYSLGAVADSLDRRGQARRVGRVARLDVVVEHDAVLVVHDLALVAELHRFAEPALGDRTGVRIVQADPPRRAVRGGASDALAGLPGDPPGRGQQFGQVVDRPGQSSAAPPGRRVV